MKLRIFKFCIFSLVLFGCGSQNPPSSDIKALVMQMVPLQSSEAPSSTPRFEVAPATFHYLRDLERLSGDYFDMTHGGELSVNETKGSLVSIKSHSEENHPHLRYDIKDGIVVPMDYNSLAMLSAYYQFDQVAHFLEKVTGISIDTIQNKFGKMRIWFEPTLKVDKEDWNLEVTLKLNAAYTPDLHSFILFKKSKLEHLPLATNYQVIAHEFGHTIFDYIFDPTGIDKRETDEEYSKTLGSHEVIYGLNEGFADFISYTYTGSTNLLAASFTHVESFTHPDQRNFSTVQFRYRDYINTKNNDRVKDRACQHGFYCIGTLFAKSLFEAQQDLKLPTSTLEERGKFTAQIVSALTQLRSKMSGNKEASDKEVLGTFFSKFLSQIKDYNMRNKIKQRLISNFGSEGFPSDFR